MPIAAAAISDLHIPPPPRIARDAAACGRQAPAPPSPRPPAPRVFATQGSWRPSVEIPSFPTRGDRLERRADRRGRLEGGAQARSAGRSRCRRPLRRYGWQGNGAIVARPHRVGILAAGPPRRAEAGADLDAFDRVDRHDRRGQLGVELGIDRRAPAGRHAGRYAFDDRRQASCPPRARLFDQSPANAAASGSPPISIIARRDRDLGDDQPAPPRPAATRAAVSRADARPPPRGSRRPYLA